MELKELIPFLAKHDVAVPTSVQITTNTVVDWVMHTLAE